MNLKHAEHRIARAIAKKELAWLIADWHTYELWVDCGRDGYSDVYESGRDAILVKAERADKHFDDFADGLKDMLYTLVDFDEAYDTMERANVRADTIYRRFKSLFMPKGF